MGLSDMVVTIAAENSSERRWGHVPTSPAAAAAAAAAKSA